MCGCKLNMVPKENSGQYENTIPIEGIMNDSTITQLKFYRCISAKKLQDAFAKFDLEVRTDADVQAIADMHDDGSDMKLFKEDFIQVARNAGYTPEELKKAECTTAIQY